MGIVRSRLHKRKVSGGKVHIHRKKRKHELGRLPANTKLGATRVTTVRVRGGNHKRRALRLDTGNFAWATEGASQRTRILDVVYNATSNELVRTKTLVKNCIVSVDATPFKTFYAKQYGIDFDLAKRKARELAAKRAKKGSAAEEATKKKKKAKKEATVVETKKVAPLVMRKRAFRLANHQIEKALEEQLKLGRILARITTRPGQGGRADGVLLEGAELAFYSKKLEKKAKK